MTRPRLAAGRAAGLGILEDPESDWALKRALAYASERAAALGECLAAAARVDTHDAESWILAWGDLARQVEEHAMDALDRGHPVSAREGLLRASNYYRTAEYGTPPNHPRFDELWGSSVRCFKSAGALFERPILPVEVPFDGCELPGYYCQASPGGSRPTVVVAGGTDSSLEEMAIQAFAAVRRGYNFFAFDHPGHRGAVHLYPHQVKRPDYEVPYRVALDVLGGLQGVDDRIALLGFSYGGYVATRVAIHEPRIKAVVPNSPIINARRALGGGFLSDVLQRMAEHPESTVDEVMEDWLEGSPVLGALLRYSRWSFGFSTFAEQFSSDVIDKHDIESDLGAIRCPTLALVSADEGDELVAQAHQYVDRVGSAHKVLHVFSLDRDGSNDHCQIDNQPRFQQLTYDWLDDVFAAGGAARG